MNNFLNIQQFAKFKKCSRPTIYLAISKGEIDVDYSIGTPIIFLNQKNKKWKPGKNVGRPKKKKR